MAPVIRISDSTFSSLKDLSTWLETETPSKTIEELVRRTLDELDLEPDSAPDQPQHTDGTIIATDSTGLSHTKITAAEVDGVRYEPITWSGILASVARALKERGFSKTDLVNAFSINTSTSRLNASGYKYKPELGISIQGQSAPDAAKEAIRLAQKHDIPLRIWFQWRDKAGAAFPGRKGIIEVFQGSSQ